MVDHAAGDGEPVSVDGIRLAIFSDNRLFSDGLQRILAGTPSLVVVGDGDDGAVRPLIRDASPHILLGDARMQAALGLCAELRQDPRCPRIILLGAEADEEWAVRALVAGARGILTKSAGAEQLIKAIRVVHEGQIWANKKVVARLVEQVALLSGATRGERALRAERLSRREQEIGRLAADGLSNREIAGQLTISQATVKAHLTRIFRKLGVRDRTQLAARYHRTSSQATTR